MKFGLWWAFITAHIIPVAVVAFLVLTNVRGCKDRNQSADAAVMHERITTDSLKLVGDSVALVNAQKQLDEANHQATQVVDRWHDVKVPVYLPPTSTPHDTIGSIAKRLSVCYAVGDSLVQSVVKIQSSCQTFHDSATKTIADLRQLSAHKDTLIKIGKPPKRWSFGPMVGYGIHQDKSWAIQRGFIAGVGIQYSLFSW